MIFDQSGSLVNASRHDYLPFGEELFGGPPNQPCVGGRTTTQGYSANDGLRNHFTGKERDNETGLDYFEARRYQLRCHTGRFEVTQAEWLSVMGNNPSSFKGDLAEPYIRLPVEQVSW